MIKKSSYLIPSDRCGVWWVSVFHLYHGFSRKTAYCGNFVKVSVKRTRPENWLKRKTKLKGIIIRTSKEIAKLDGTYVRFFFNSTVLLKKRLTPRGKEVTGPIVSIIRRRKFKSSFPGII
jgi:large subunit ribosomal protein L14